MPQKPVLRVGIGARALRVLIKNAAGREGQLRSRVFKEGGGYLSSLVNMRRSFPSSQVHVRSEQTRPMTPVWWMGKASAWELAAPPL